MVGAFFVSAFGETPVTLVADASYVISGEHDALTKNAQVLLHTTTHRHVHAVLATRLTPIEASYIIRSEA